MSEKIQFVGRSKFLSAPLRKQIRQTIMYFADIHLFNIESLVYVHQTDAELHAINMAHLEHDTLTDIITFDLSDMEGVLDGEIYISVDRVRDNALSFNVPFEDEYLRVVSHGLFHLMGYGDKTPEEEVVMRNKENEAINYFNGLRST